MPNTWDYTIVLREPIEDHATIAERALEIGESIGYALAGESWVLDPEGEEHLLETRGEVLDFLATRGGLVTLWCERKQRDIGLSFDWEGLTISVGVLHDLLPAGDLADDGQGGSAADLEAMFTMLCGELKPAYGYSSDEWMLEAALGTRDFPARWRAFEQTVREQRPPPLLFWLNYFARDYFERVGAERLAAVPHRVVRLGDEGVFVYLSDHPWDAQMALLDAEGRRYVAAFASAALASPAKRNGVCSHPRRCAPRCTLRHSEAAALRATLGLPFRPTGRECSAQA